VVIVSPAARSMGRRRRRALTVDAEVPVADAEKIR
jgi:hypothetical protein